MSESASCLPLLKPSPCSFAHTLLLGGLFVAAVLAMQTANQRRTPEAGAAHGPMLLRVIDARPQAPAMYDAAYRAEQQMSSAQLLNRWDAFVSEASLRFHVPKAWIRAVMRQESGGRTVLAPDKPIVSRAGAIGLMQVMPSTYDEMAQAHRLGDDPMNARDNIMAGTAYLRWLHQRYGYPRMFAAYNAGPGRLEKGGLLPAETRAYLAGVTATVRIAKGGDDMVNLTRPDGQTVKLDPGTIVAIRAPLPGEYGASVQAVLTVGRRTQAVRETIQVATAAIRATGGRV